MGGHRDGAAEDDEQGVQLSQPLLRLRALHHHGPDGAGGGAQPEWRLLCSPFARSTTSPNIFQSTQPSTFSCSSTCSSVSPPASDDGFVDGSDESADETESLAEMVEDKLDLSLEDKLDLSFEESDNEIGFEILDEDLERVVRSIIEEDD